MTWDYGVFLEEAIKLLRSELADQEYTMWLSRLAYVSSTADKIIAGTPSGFYRDQIAQRYQKMLEAKLLELHGAPLGLEIQVSKVEATPVSENKAPAPDIIEAARPSPLPNDGPVIVETRQASSKGFVRHPQLNPDYVFENFVIGENNGFAANAAIAIAKNPGKAYNPCLIYGGVGLGKTHLLQSVGNYIHQEDPEKKIIYISMENFTNEFVQCIRENRMQSFKNKYRSVDVLLIDDIHFIQKMEGTQEELFFTFEALIHNQKQMIFSCDRPITEVKEISERLRSRFQRGFTVDLQPPSFEIRLAILKKKCDSWGISIPDDSLSMICNLITTNVRDLEAALTKLRAYSELVSKQITPEITKSLLKDSVANINQKNITLDAIIKIVAQYFNLTPFDMQNKKRNRALVYPRQIAMYIAREITEYSTTEIGHAFGGRDHSTVMHSCDRITDRLKTDATLEPTIKELIRSIRQDHTKS